MRIACPHCAAGYDFPVELIAGDAFHARCVACAGGFRVDRAGRAEATGAPPGWSSRPATGTPQDTTPMRPAAPPAVVPVEGLPPLPGREPTLPVPEPGFEAEAPGPRPVRWPDGLEPPPLPPGLAAPSRRGPAIEEPPPLPPGYEAAPPRRAPAIEEPPPLPPGYDAPSRRAPAIEEPPPLPTGPAAEGGPPSRSEAPETPPAATFERAPRTRVGPPVPIAVITRAPPPTPVTPVPVETGPETDDEAAEGIPAEASLEGYLIVHGAAIPGSEPRRRRVSPVGAPPGTRRPRARIVSLPSTFGRSRRGEPPMEAPIAVPPAEVVATPPENPRARWPAIAAVAAAFLCGVGGSIAVGLYVTRPPETPEREAFGVAAATTPEPEAPGTEPELRPESTTLDIELQAVEVIPERHAAVIHGQLFNGTDVVQGGIRIEATLRVDDLPKRRREVWCCDPLDRPAAEAAAHDPRHPHYMRDRDPAAAQRLDPGDVRSFSVVFPALDETLLKARLGAVLRIKQAAPAAPPSAAQGGGAPTSAAPAPSAPGAVPPPGAPAVPVVGSQGAAAPPPGPAPSMAIR